MLPHLPLAALPRSTQPAMRSFQGGAGRAQLPAPGKTSPKVWLAGFPINPHPSRSSARGQPSAQPRRERERGSWAEAGQFDGHGEKSSTCCSAAWWAPWRNSGTRTGPGLINNTAKGGSDRALDLTLPKSLDATWKTKNERFLITQRWRDKRNKVQMNNSEGWRREILGNTSYLEREVQHPLLSTG